MRLTAVVCAVIGHHWVQPADVHEEYPLFECRRCGLRQEFAPGSRSAGYGARLDARTGADKFFPGRR